MEGLLFLVIAAVIIVGYIIIKENYDKPDVNNDGKVDLKDLTAAANKVKEEVVEKAVEVKAKVVEKAKVVADVNKDGNVNLKDVVAAANKVKEEVKTQASKVNKNLNKKKK
jgi:lysozyme family protein